MVQQAPQGIVDSGPVRGDQTTAPSQFRRQPAQVNGVAPGGEHQFDPGLPQAL
jgi:hypothetical protein